MKKVIYAIIAVIIIAIVVMNFTRASDPKVIKIGIIAPLTGGAAVFGNSLIKGVEMALADLKDTKYKYEIVIEDDGTNPGTAASAAQKLINVDKVSALISGTSGTANAIVSFADAAKIPHICVVCSDKKIGRGSYNFTNSVLPEDEADAWYAYATKQGIKTLGLATQIHPGVNAVTEAIKAKAAANGVSVIFAEQYDANNRDFKTIVKKAKGAGADHYFIMSFPPSIDIIGKDLKDLGIKNLSSAAGGFMIAANPSAFEGNWYTDTILSDSNFMKRFQDAYPNVRFNVRTAPFGYDTFNMLVDGLDKDLDMAIYLAGLKEYNGKSGKIMKTDGNYFRSTPGIWHIKNGKPEVIK